MTDENHLPRHLLLIDDEPNILNALKRTLHREGYTIFTAGSGAEGLELLATYEIGVIISDQRMPQMTGVEFLRKVKVNYPKTIRLVLSGYTELETVTSAVNEGAIYKFLTKPWDDEQLRIQIQDAFLRYEMKQENLRLTEQLKFANEQLSRLNQNLEQQVAEKTSEIIKNITILQISQEILEYLPLAIIGIDDQQIIAISNRRADELFRHSPSQSLLGLPISQCLPEALLSIVQNVLLSGITKYDHGVLPLFEGMNTRVGISEMGRHSNAKGTILILSPFKAN